MSSDNSKKGNRSQVEVTGLVKEIADGTIGHGFDFLDNAKQEVHRRLMIRPYNEDTREHEAAIRWKRSANQILEDGYVYYGKSCTDMVVVFIALCKAKGYETRFDKLIKEIDGRKLVHSVAEVKLEDGWYVVDISGSGGIKKGELKLKGNFNGYRLWKKGRDAWDLGLTDYESMKKIGNDKIG
jgi:hypothetical protein